MEINVLHVLRTYLPVTENWLFHLLDNTEGVQHTIYCEKFSPGIFHTKKFDFLPLPVGYESEFGQSFPHKLIRFFFNIFRHVTGITKQRYFSQLIKTEKPSIIHIHFGTMALAYEAVLMKTTTPFVVSYYGYDYNPTYNYKNIFHKVTAVICEGKAGKEQLIGLGCPDEKIKIVPLGIIPLERVTLKRKPEGRLHLVQIASFTEKKGHIYTIRAVEKALSACPNIRLTLIGPDSFLKRKMMAYVHENKLDKKILFKDGITPDNLSEELKQYDVFIHPSVTAENGDNEGGAPVVLLNAQNVGLPVISTYHKDIPDYVIHGITGFLAPEKDVGILSSLIIEFYKMKEQSFLNFSTNARNHVHKYYDLRENAQKLSSLYHTIIKT